tara:strand:- start:1309 stop:2025 length:717 start_codon:yes stop_codon:yes gene_type:complete
MENEMTNDNNPALIDIYLEALKMQESSGNYQAQHKAEVITDIVTGKKIRVQAIGAYGILDINWTGTKTQKSWAEQAGYSGADWHDPVAQDAVAKYKVQEYFNKYGSWDAVSVAWFSGEGNANKLVKNGTIDYSASDSNGQTIENYVDEMNTKISEQFMNMEVPIKPYTPPQIIEGPQTNPMVDSQRNQQEVFAAQILDAMTKANAGGMRPSFESQVPAEAGDFADTVAQTQVRRGDIQ